MSGQTLCFAPEVDASRFCQKREQGHPACAMNVTAVSAVILWSASSYGYYAVSATITDLVVATLPYT